MLDPQGLPYEPGLMAGMKQAVSRLTDAVRAGEKVAVYGDFDVDGITGTAILTETLRRLGADTVPYLPDPVAEGHGMTPDAVNRLIDDGVSLIVTVDCGISNFDEVALAVDRGAEVIITDHHTPPELCPDAVAIVSPRVPGSQYPYGELCGAGVAYKLACGLEDHLGVEHDESLMELAALGTIADLVPLRDENRHLVQHGLAALSHTGRPGMRALLRRTNLDGQEIRSEHVSFQIAPRLNAPGRMAHPITALNLLLTRDSREADQLAGQLEQYNQRRRDLTARAVEIAIGHVSATAAQPSIIITHDKEYTPGINGLIAGRLAERFNCPAIALATVDPDHLVASARSAGGFNLIEAISRCGDLLTRFGGHAAAAGFTVSRDNYDAVAQRLLAIADSELGLFGAEPTLEIHAEGNLDEILDPEMVRLRERLEPFGKDNPTPRYLARRTRVLNWGYVGANSQHLKLQVSSGSRVMDALWWNYSDDWGGYGTVDLVFQIAEERYRGERRNYLRIDDLRPAA